MKLRDKMVIWPANLDSTKTRNRGRKLPKSQGIQTPRLDELSEAGKKLSSESELAQGKSRPPVWWEKTGYLIFEKKESKARTLRSLASEIRRARAAKAQTAERKKT